MQSTKIDQKHTSITERNIIDGFSNSILQL